LRRALPSVEHFVFCHPDSSLLNNTAVFCTKKCAPTFSQKQVRSNKLPLALPRDTRMHTAPERDVWHGAITEGLITEKS
jgi:hypothetical protein